MKFRRKPTVIEAVQFDGDNAETVYAAYGAEFFDYLGDADGWMLAFTTAHGDQAFARAGDWIVPDSEPGTFYPIKPDVFEASYEVFNYDEELTEESSDEAVLSKVRSSLMATLPMSQINLIEERLTTGLATTNQVEEKIRGRQ